VTVDQLLRALTETARPSEALGLVGEYFGAYDEVGPFSRWAAQRCIRLPALARELELADDDQ
jgi:hypothetical protein